MTSMAVFSLKARAQDINLYCSDYLHAQRGKKYKQRMYICRMVPLVENNFNYCELGPRSTGKSHLYKEVSPNSILVSGGQTTVANLFYNMARKQIGLVGLWDCVAFDEVAGIHFKDHDGIQIMKDYMPPVPSPGARRKSLPRRPWFS